MRIRALRAQDIQEFLQNALQGEGAGFVVGVATAFSQVRFTK